MRSESENLGSGTSVADFVEDCLRDLKLTVIAGESGIRRRKISAVEIQRLGMALANFGNYIRSESIQIIGNTETSYLRQLDPEKRRKLFLELNDKQICCIVVTNNNDAPIEIINFANKFGIPVLRTPESTSVAIARATMCLQSLLAQRLTTHGVLMDMHSIGVLLLGESGIGKSESALDLIARGHKLISDDSVMLKKIGNSLVGSSPELTRGHLEIRGLGIINIRDIFGVSAISQNKEVGLLIELKKWDDLGEVERLGLDTQEVEILGVNLTKIVLPVSAGRNLSTLIETAVRVYLLRISGVSAAKILFEKHLTLMNPPTTASD